MNSHQIVTTLPEINEYLSEISTDDENDFGLYPHSFISPSISPKDKIIGSKDSNEIQKNLKVLLITSNLNIPETIKEKLRI